MSETHVQVQSACAGLVFLEGSSDTHESMGVSLANGVAEVTPSQPFLVRVLNLSRQERVLPKNMVLGTVQPHPNQIISPLDSTETIQDEDLHSVRVPDLSPLRDWRSELDLRHLSPPWRRR